MRCRGVAVAALLTVLAWPDAAAGAECAPAIKDPSGVLEASSRLTGAVAALERLDVGVTIVVAGDARNPAPSSASCAASASRRAGAVLVALQGQPLEAAVQGSGSVRPALAQQAERQVRARLQATPADASSAVAHGLELVWQEQDQRGQEVAPPPEESAGAVGGAEPEAVRALPSAAAVNLVNGMLLIVVGGLAAGGVVAAAVLAGARWLARRRLLRHLRVRASACRSGLAERYVDLDARMATIVTAIDACTASMDPATAARTLRLATARKAAVDAAALRAGAALLATPADLQRAAMAQAADIADRCAATSADLEEAVLQLSRTAVDAGTVPGPLVAVRAP